MTKLMLLTLILLASGCASLNGGRAETPPCEPITRTTPGGNLVRACW